MSKRHNADHSRRRERALPLVVQHARDRDDALDVDDVAGATPDACAIRRLKAARGVRRDHGARR